MASHQYIVPQTSSAPTYCVGGVVFGVLCEYTELQELETQGQQKANLVIGYSAFFAVRALPYKYDT